MTLKVLSNLLTIHSAFVTIQGEGIASGAKIVLVRFSGCNIWSGIEERRALDSSKGCCAAWCDTEFSGVDPTNHGGRYSYEGLADLIYELWEQSCDSKEAKTKDSQYPAALLTGGEPTLQVGAPLLNHLYRREIETHIETNGSVRADLSLAHILTISPKPPAPVIPRDYDALKIVYPAVDPDKVFELYPHLKDVFPRYIIPQDGPGDTLQRNTEAAIRYVLRSRGEWALGAQLHKVWRLP